MTDAGAVTIRALLTPSSDKEPHKVKLKVFWAHDRYWTDQDIAQYHEEAQGIASGMQRNGTKHTCDKFALSILIKFASKHKLPIKIRTGAGTFRNIELYDSQLDNFASTPIGYGDRALPHFAAPDMVNNTKAVGRLADLKSGDILLQNDQTHVQVVMWANDSQIHIKQGNFPSGSRTIRGYAENAYDGIEGKIEGLLNGTSNTDADPNSPFYLGVPIQDGDYIRESDGRWSYQNITLNRPKNYSTFQEMPFWLMWDFYAFNH